MTEEQQQRLNEALDNFTASAKRGGYDINSDFVQTMLTHIRIDHSITNKMEDIIAKGESMTEVWENVVKEFPKINKAALQECNVYNHISNAAITSLLNQQFNDIVRLKEWLQEFGSNYVKNGKLDVESLTHDIEWSFSEFHNI